LHVVMRLYLTSYTPKNKVKQQQGIRATTSQSKDNKFIRQNPK
jgi:hypothetical protein